MHNPLLLPTIDYALNQERFDLVLLDKDVLDTHGTHLINTLKNSRKIPSEMPTNTTKLFADRLLNWAKAFKTPGVSTVPDAADELYREKDLIGHIRTSMHDYITALQDEGKQREADVESSALQHLDKALVAYDAVVNQTQHKAFGFDDDGLKLSSRILYENIVAFSKNEFPNMNIQNNEFQTGTPLYAGEQLLAYALTNTTKADSVRRRELKEPTQSTAILTSSSKLEPMLEKYLAESGREFRFNQDIGLFTFQRANQLSRQKDSVSLRVFNNSYNESTHVPVLPENASYLARKSA